MFQSLVLRACRGLLAAAVLFACLPAAAQELFAPETITLAGDARIAAADGETSWLDGGYGKTRHDDVRPRLAEAELIWQPRLTWALTGTIVVIAQQGQDKPIDISEAMLAFKPLMGGETRVSARAGLFWPPVSVSIFVFVRGAHGTRAISLS